MRPNLSPEIQEAVKILWDYHHMSHSLQKSDIILVHGNHQIDTIRHAVDVFKQGFAPYMVITGGLGSVTKGIWNEPEADKFAKIAIENGIPADKIIIENKSSNLGEHYSFAKKILDDNGLPYKKAIIVTKPYQERRAYATGKAQWKDTEFIASSIPLSMNDYFDSLDNPERNINLMVGDLQRIAVFPEKGFQIHQDIPKEVMDAFELLVKNGYDKDLADR